MRRRTRYSSRNYGWLWGIIVLVGFMALISGCTVGVASIRSDKPAIHLAENLGFSHVRDIGRSVWFPALQGCGRDDIVLIHLVGINAAGKRATLNVCEGIIKGATARG